jgi:hypothetical protein
MSEEKRGCHEEQKCHIILLELDTGLVFVLVLGLYRYTNSRAACFIIGPRHNKCIVEASIAQHIYFGQYFCQPQHLYHTCVGTYNQQLTLHFDHMTCSAADK